MHAGEVVVVGAAHVGKLGSDAEGHVVAGEVYLVAGHGREAEVIGVGTLIVDRLGCCLQVAEGGHVATEREAAGFHVGRAYAGRIAALRTAAEVHVGEDYDAAQRTGVDDALQEHARSRGVHHQLLVGVVVARDGNVGRNEVDVVRDALEAVTDAEVDRTAQRQRELIVLRGEDELRAHGLLEARTVGLEVVLFGVLDGHAVEQHGLAGGLRVADRLGFVHRDEVDRRGVLLVVTRGRITLGRSGGGEQQRYRQKSKCFHTLKNEFGLWNKLILHL